MAKQALSYTASLFGCAFAQNGGAALLSLIMVVRVHTMGQKRNLP